MLQRNICTKKSFILGEMSQVLEHIMTTAASASKEVIAAWVNASKTVSVYENASQYKTGYIVVFLITTVLAVTEPILVAYPPHGWHYALQITVLAVSTLFYSFGILLLGKLFELHANDDLHPVHDDANQPQTSPYEQGGNQNQDVTSQPLTPANDKREPRKPIHFYLVALFQPAVMFEGSCLIIGWACIFEAPGLAAVRCFRVFCFFRAVELVQDLFGNKPKSEEEAIETYHKLLPWIPPMLGKLVGKLIFLFFSICDQNMGYFRKLYAELFTSKSRGGAVVLLIFFYTSYVVAAVLWRDRGLFEFYYDPSGLTNGTAGDWHCVTLRSCWVNVLRLSFYDGNGFDLLSSILYAGQWHLFLLILTYMVFTGIILLNGLLGIFSHAFERDGAPPAPMPPGLDPKRAEELQALRGRLEDLHRQSHEMLILFDASMRPRPAAPTSPIARMRKQTTEIVLSVDPEHSLEVRVAAAAFYVVAFLLSVAEPIVIGCGSQCDPHQNIQARAASLRPAAQSAGAGSPRLLAALPMPPLLVCPPPSPLLDEIDQLAIRLLA